MQSKKSRNSKKKRDFSRINNDENFKKLKEEYDKLKVKYKDDILALLEGESIPLSIFCKKLTVFQSLVKYLHEELKYGFSKIGEKLGKDRRSVWSAYQKSSIVKKKFSNIGRKIPLLVFTDSKYSVMENLVVYLKKSMKYSEIAKLLNRDERTIWTVYNRARVKNEE